MPLPGDINIAVAPTKAAFANQELFLSDKVNTMIEELRKIFREYLYMMHPKYKRGSGINPFPSGMPSAFERKWSLLNPFSINVFQRFYYA